MYQASSAIFTATISSSPCHSNYSTSHGILSTKPKITKIILIVPQLSMEIQKQNSVAQCTCGHNITHIYPPHRSWRFAGTRRRFRRRVGTWGMRTFIFWGGDPSVGTTLHGEGAHGPAMLVWIGSWRLPYVVVYL